MSILDSARRLTQGDESDAALASAMEVEDDTEWVTDVYSQLIGTPTRIISTRWQRLNMYRLFIIVLSALLLGLGVALVVPRSSCVSSFIPSMGTDCASVTTVSYVIAGLLFLTGVLGCLTSCKYPRLPLSCCIAVLFFCYAVLCGAFAGFVVYSRLHQLENLELAWRQLVTLKSFVVCDAQLILGCSGFAEGQCCRGAPLIEDGELFAVKLAEEVQPCFFEAANGSTYDVHDRNEITWPNSMCLPSCGESSKKTALTCEAPLKSTVNHYFFHFVFMLSGLALLFVALGCVVIAGLLWKPRIDNRMVHRF